MNTAKEQESRDMAVSRTHRLDRVRGVSYADFVRRYVQTGTPAIIEDAIDHWPALGKWTPSFWKDRYGERTVEIDGTSYRLGELIRLAEQSSSGDPAPYYRNIRIRSEFPELLADISPYPPLCGPNWFHSLAFRPIRERVVGGGGHYELFIGGEGRAFPFLHYDAPGAHTFIHQIIGRKKFVLFKSDDGQFLYPCAGKAFSVSQIKNLDDVYAEQFPLFRNATKYEEEAKPGDTLFMPSGTWHTAKMTSFSVSLGIDVVNETNWPDVVAYVKRRMSFERAAVSAAYLSVFRTTGFLAGLTHRFSDKRDGQS
jgi:hypothetical protein